MFRHKTCALILTTSIAVSCRTAGPVDTPPGPAPPPPPPIGSTATSDPADRGATPPEAEAKTKTFNIPSFDFTLLPPKFLQHLRETSPIVHGPPPTYGKSRKNPAIIMSNGTYALMDQNSIITRKWTGGDTTEMLDVVSPRFSAYVDSNAYALGIDPVSLQVPLPPESFVNEIPADMSIRQQSFSRLTCVAHASLAAMEIRSDVPNDLSEQYAHHVFLQNLTTPSNCCDDSGVFVLDAAHDLENNGIPVESDFPYTTDPPACKGRSGFPCLDDNGHDATLPVLAPRYRVTGIGEIPEGTG
ncbi:MAG: Papain family cysteine protease, partial [Acidobacteria bacterium]|nr:Papain family cysteine protease [Acidobacteriota bacterium]